MPVTLPTINTPDLWKGEQNANPVPPTPLVILTSLIIAAILFLVGGLVANNRLPNNPANPAVDQGGAQPLDQ